jgi:hypothetical protein
MAHIKYTRQNEMFLKKLKIYQILEVTILTLSDYVGIL